MEVRKYACKESPVDVFLALIGPFVCLGISWLLCQEGIDALRQEKAIVRGHRITGLWARFVGGAYLLVGVPLAVLSLVVIVSIIGSAFSGSL